MVNELSSQAYMIFLSPFVLLFVFSKSKSLSLRERILQQLIKAMKWSRPVLFSLFFSLKVIKGYPFFQKRIFTKRNHHQPKTAAASYAVSV
jgi:hypothetical protein